MDIQTLLPLLQAHAWLALALVVLPQLDKMIAAGEWPFSLAVPVKYRFVLITIGGGAVSVLESIQGGAVWYSALLSGVLVVAFTLLKNGAGLFGKLSPQLKDAPPADMPGVIAKLASKAPPPMIAVLFGLAIAAGVVAPVSGCTPQAKVVEREVLDIIQTACILAAPIDASVPELALACGIAEADIPLLEKIIAGRKAGYALKLGALK